VAEVQFTRGRRTGEQKDRRRKGVYRISHYLSASKRALFSHAEFLVPGFLEEIHWHFEEVNANFAVEPFVVPTPGALWGLNVVNFAGGTKRPL